VFWIEIFQSTVFNPAMHVRPAVHADLPGILEIYNDAVLNTTATYDCEPRTLEHRLAWFEEHAKNNYPVYVAEDGLGRIVGWSALNAYHARAGYRFTTENSVYVAADHRGCGIGKRLMPPLVIAARERGLHAILAGIDAENDASIRLHASFGFVQVGCFKQVGFKFGRWLDVIYMELLLGNRE
jgi:phosphinothricin acetyltransferase